MEMTKGYTEILLRCLCQGRNRNPFAVLLLLFPCAVGCSPTIYKSEVASFAASVNTATKSFEDMRGETLAKRRTDAEAEIAKGSRAAVSEECSAIVDDMRTTAQCLANWASYRSSMAAGEHPSPPSGKCATEPGGFAEIPKAKAAQCSFGSRDANGTFVAPQASRTLPYPHISAIATQLGDYAKGLAEIVDAKDQEELMTATGNAKTALLKLRDDVAAEQAKKSGSAQAAPAPVDTLGPVADLVSAGLVTALAQRRYQALSKVAHGADDVVHDAAEELSKAAFTMYWETRIEPGEEDLTKTVNKTNVADVGKAAFPARIHDAAEAHAHYVAILDADLGAAFKAVAEAHHSLVAALDDPRTQYDSLKANVQDLAEKASAVQSALEKQKEQEEKMKKAAAHA